MQLTKWVCCIVTSVHTQLTNNSVRCSAVLGTWKTYISFQIISFFLFYSLHFDGCYTVVNVIRLFVTQSLYQLGNSIWRLPIVCYQLVVLLTLVIMLYTDYRMYYNFYVYLLYIQDCIMSSPMTPDLTWPASCGVFTKRWCILTV